VGHMKLINSKEIKNQINNCYEHYDPYWNQRIGDTTIMNGFKYYLEREAGLKLDLKLKHEREYYGIRLTQLK
jgi:dissimilatory sulfite reductase (desulfoviridin) alpha/beta subunit